MERNLPGSSSAISVSNIQDNPYGIVLEHLDVLDLAENNDLMNEVIKCKKELLDDAKLMRKILNLDQISEIKEKPKIKKKSKTRRMEINHGNELMFPDLSASEIKVEENSDEDEEEEIPEDAEEEENDYMESHFDNGEEFID